MIAYFPTIYPGEILYSVLARYYLHSGIPPTLPNLENLFGKRNVIANYDLSGALDLLAERISPIANIGIESIISDLTLYPYFTAFVPPTLRREIRLMLMRGEIFNVHLKLGIAAFKVGTPRHLRFCSVCNREMVKEFSELYWKREHQLSSVFVCPKHHCPLRISEVAPKLESRHRFIAATEVNCPESAPQIFLKNEPIFLQRLQQLATRSVELLEGKTEARTMNEWTNFYRGAMLEAGLVRTKKSIDQVKFASDFRSFYGDVLSLFPMIITSSGFSGDWLASMVRKHRHVKHPLLHLLLQNFLDGREPHSSLFGKGPWQCLNPLAPHYFASTISEVSTHRNHGNVVGVFRCKCGYVYTRCFNSASNKIGKPRFLSYGKLLEPTLRKLVHSGAKLREIGRLLKLDPKTVLISANRLGIDVNWKIGPSKKCSCDSGDRTSHEMPLEPVKKITDGVSVKSHLRKLRVNWNELDLINRAALENITSDILKECPPVRVTFSELERRLGRIGWLRKRRDHLPITMAYLNEVVECTSTFQIRRILWVIGEHGKDVSLRAWEVMRKAGLRSKHLKEIQSILSKIK